MTATILSRVPVAKKLLLLVLIPCLLQAFFVVLLAVILAGAQKELQQAEHQRDALISLKATTNAAAISLMKIRNPESTSDEGVSAELKNIELAFRGQNGELSGLDSARYPELKEIIEDARAMRGEMETLVRQAQQNVSKFNPKSGRKLDREKLVDRALIVTALLDFQSIAKRIVAAEASTKLSDVQRINTVQKTVNIAIFTVLGINALITIVFLYLFTRDIVERLKLVSQNTHKLALTGKPLAPCPGDDEIAALDAALQEVARQLEEFRKQKLAVLDNATDVVFTLDDKLKLEAVNKASLSNWSMEPDDLLGRSFLSILDADSRQAVGQKLGAFLAQSLAEQGGETRVEAAIACRSGLVKTFDITFAKLAGASGLTGVARDITQQKAVAALKERLLSIVSHDLRTPLASLSITLSVIVEGQRIADRELMQKLQVIDASVQRVLALTHDLLGLEKQEAELANLSFAPVKAYNVWLQAKSILQPLCQERRVTLNGPSEDAELYGNEEKLVQAINLIGRTVLNLSAAGGKLELSIERAAGSGRIRISTDRLIAGSGTGEAIAERMRKVDQEDIFDSDNICLSIARAIIEKHEGQLFFSGSGQVDIRKEFDGQGGFEIAILLPSTAGASG